LPPRQELAVAFVVVSKHPAAAAVFASMAGVFYSGFFRIRQARLFVAIDLEKVVTLVETAGRRVGQKELQKAGQFHVGEAPALATALRQLVKEGRLVRDGKRFGVPGPKPKLKSGPAWQQEASSKRLGIKKQRALTPEPERTKDASGKTEFAHARSHERSRKAEPGRSPFAPKVTGKSKP
jgi:hypothetical protein